jgi:hypothetical protein
VTLDDPPDSLHVNTFHTLAIILSFFISMRIPL